MTYEMLPWGVEAGTRGKFAYQYIGWHLGHSGLRLLIISLLSFFSLLIGAQVLTCGLPSQCMAGCCTTSHLGKVRLTLRKWTI